MAGDGVARNRQQGLQQAASLIFALVAIVPLLIFAWTLHSLGAIRSTLAQLSLGLALAVALLGFWMFRSLLGRMAEVVQALAAAVEQAHRSRRAVSPAAATPSAPVSRPPDPTAPAAATAAPGNGGAAPVRATAPRAAGPARPDASSSPGPAVAGIGNIRELTEVVRAMDALWHREASAHLGLRVRISVANSREPLVGTLSEASSDGLILDGADGPLVVAYSRVTAIDRLS
jgi:hypothetical protein